MFRSIKKPSFCKTSWSWIAVNYSKDHNTTSNSTNSTIIRDHLGNLVWKLVDIKRLKWKHLHFLEFFGDVFNYYNGEVIMACVSKDKRAFWLFDQGIWTEIIEYFYWFEIGGRAAFFFFFFCIICPLYNFASWPVLSYSLLLNYFSFRFWV